MTRKSAADPPSKDVLRTMLGPSFAAYESFVEKNGDLRPEWKYYGKAGWSLKLFDKRRNLCFITPREDEFSIAFLLGRKAVETALVSTLPEAVKHEIREARTYVEGRPVKLTVRKERDLAPARKLLQIKREA
jgi:hypothetical protein